MGLKIKFNSLWFTATLPCAVLCVMLTACGSGGQFSGKQVFQYNEPTGIASLDPAFAKNQSIIWAVNQLYSTLVETDSNLQVKPLLAKRWEVSEDRRTYTFFLRSDVWFHDNKVFPNGKGRKMTASDVVYSFQRLLDPSTASPGAWIFNHRIDTMKGFSAPNDSVFVLKLKQPFSPILGVISNKYCSIVPMEVVSFYGKDFRSHPCGTGPFQFHEWEEGQALILWKNNHYFEKDEKGKPLPYLDAIKVRFNDSRATEFLLFQQGEIDFINDIDPSFKDEVLTKRGMLKKQWEGKLRLQKHAYLNTEYLGILCDSTAGSPLLTSPLRLKKVRQAINYGFDRRKLMLYLRNSIGKPAESGFVPAGLPSFNEELVKGYRYDPVYAKKLLQEARYDPSQPIKLLTIPVYADLASFIVRQLEDIGMKVVVEVIPKSLLLEQTAQSKALFFRASWIADYPDAENYLSLFYGKNPAPPNYTRFNNAAYDALFEKAMTTTDDSIRYSLYQKLDKIVMEEAPVVPLWYDQAIHLVSNKMSGFEANSLNLLELRKAIKK
jgi:peptide/nickel transport system substrate-binding protein